MGGAVSERHVTVYGWWEVAKGPPSLNPCPSTIADRLIENGLAEACNHGRAIKLLEHQKPPRFYTLRGSSCRIQAWLLQQLGGGSASRYAIEIQRAWRFSFPVRDESMMQYSRNGLDLTQTFEQLRLRAYWDALGKVWTIGYGHTGPEVREGLVWTRNQAMQALQRDVAAAEAAVNALVTAALTQEEFDALVDFVFNLGVARFKASTLLRMLNTGDYAGCASQFARWDYASGQVVAGLLRRRQAEAAEFVESSPASEALA